MNNVTCTLCRKEYHRKKSLIEKYNAGKILPFCSQSCYNSHRTKLIKIKCVNCGGEFDRQPAQISKNNFCSQSCSAKYNNTHKTKGNLRSKLEKYLEKQLTELYPNLEIHFNRKDTINSELDIYIPCLKIAFELNGIFHYEPIYGQEKLTQIQNNDNRKFQACIEKGIGLCIVDTSSQKYFKESTSKVFLNIICNIIDGQLNLTSV